jgi:hypothetical protein
MTAVDAGYRVLCTTATELVTTLAKALAEHRFEARFTRLCQPTRLIIDEIGDLPLETPHIPHPFSRFSSPFRSARGGAERGAIYSGIMRYNSF